MAEVLFYERPVSLNRDQHKDLHLKAVPNVKFAKNVHSVPLTCAEFGIASRDLLIVFAGNSAAESGPIALLGLRQEENLFIDAHDQWVPNIYIPAFVRRYPFVLAESPAAQEGDDFVVFLDEGFEGFNDSEGERLFKEDGTDSELLTNAVNFLGEFQQNITRTKKFMEHLITNDLLVPRNVQLQKGGGNGKSINLNGLFVIDEDKLRGLSEKITHELMVEGVLGWAYAHLLSLNNIDRLAARLDERESAEDAAGATMN